jgi:hypothetical protein
VLETGTLLKSKVASDEAAAVVSVAGTAAVSEVAGVFSTVEAAEASVETVVDSAAVSFVPQAPIPYANAPVATNLSRVVFIYCLLRRREYA